MSLKQEIDKSISMAVSTGKVIVGYKKSLSAINSGKAKAAVISDNMPDEQRTIFLRNCKLSSIPVIKYNKSGIELGAICGRPHRVSVLSIIDPGDSKILESI